MRTAPFPGFLKNDPVLWIAQVTAYLNYLGVESQEDRFSFTVVTIGEPAVHMLRDLIIQPPLHEPFNRLRDAIVQRFSTPKRLRLRQLLAGERIGDRTPSQFLRHLQCLAGDTREPLNAALLREFFIQGLPIDVQLALAAYDYDAALETLAAAADRATEVSSGFVASANQSSYYDTEALQSSHCLMDTDVVCNASCMTAVKQFDTPEKESCHYETETSQCSHYLLDTDVVCNASCLTATNQSDTPEESCYDNVPCSEVPTVTITLEDRNDSSANSPEYAAEVDDEDYRTNVLNRFHSSLLCRRGSKTFAKNNFGHFRTR